MAPLSFLLYNFIILLSLPYFAVVFMGSALFALQQLSGINAVFYFSSTVFKSFGVPSDLANICVGIANLSGSDGFALLLVHFGTCAYIFLFTYSLFYSRVSYCNDLNG